MAEFPTKSTGEVVTAADWNQIEDYVSLSGAILRKGSGQTLPTGSTTELTWETAVYDRGGWVDLANNRFVVPAGVEFVRILASIRFATNDNGARRLTFAVNGSGSVVGVPDVMVGASQSLQTRIAAVSAPIAVSANDTIECRAFQNSGLNLDIENVSNTWFAVERVIG